MLNSGVVEIDKERKRLVKAAHTAQLDLDMVRQEHEEVSRHLQMREMEVASMAERIREQEKRLAGANNDNSELKCVIDQLDAQIVKVKTLLEESEYELKGKEQHWQDEKASFTQELSDRKDKISTLSENLSTSANLNEEQSHTVHNLEHTLSNMRAELNKVQLHHVQTLDKMEEELENERHSHVETLEKLTSTREHLHKENGDLVEELQKTKKDYSMLQENHRASVEAVNQLTNELEEESQFHVNAQEQFSTTKEQLEKENHDLVEELEKTKTDYSLLQEDRLAGDETTSSLMKELETERQSHAVTQEKLAATKEQLEKEADDIAEELQKAKAQLQSTSENIISLEKELDDEKATANKFRSQLRELNLQLKENDTATSNQVHTLERELDEVRQKYEMIIVNHQDEIQSMQKQHEDELADFETRGADVISDLEDTIASLQKEITEGKMGNEESVSKMQQELSMELDRLAHIIAEHERKGSDQKEKIEALSLYGKQRKEETKTLQSELARVQNVREDKIREKEETIASLRNDLENTCSIHEQEMAELRITIEDIRGQLVSAKDRLASEDGELESAKVALSDRTNLIRDMVDQTKAYQNDLERERNRAVQLEVAVRSYKKQLAEARDSSHGLEEEIHEKDTQYCEAIRNERNQRKSVEAELDSFRLSMEDALRRRNEIEKENVALKDKVQRQEKYIGRLQDRDKQNRRQSKAPRPSYMAGVETDPPPRLRTQNSNPVHSPVRVGSKIGAGLKQYQQSLGSEENTRPNLSRRIIDEDFSESARSDEMASLLR